jgi:hypothetical protein
MTSPPEQDYRKTGRYGEGSDNLIWYVEKQ